MFPIVCCVGALLGGVFSEQAHQSMVVRDRAELEHLESVWNEAHERGDVGALDKLWAAELIVTVPGMPLMRKADSMALWQSGRMKFQRYTTSDLEILVFGDAAVVAGRLERQRSVNGESVADDWRFTKVCVRRDGSWRVVAWHASESRR
jgi:ketosteroid isomerase-like protein